MIGAMVSVIKPVITECSFEGRRWSFPIRWVPFRIVESKSAGHQKRAYQSSEGNNVHEGNAEKSFFLYRLMYTHVYTKKKKKKATKLETCHTSDISFLEACHSVVVYFGGL